VALPITDLQSYTTQEIVPRTTDLIFKKSPLLQRLLSRNMIRFDGGTYIQRPLMYAELNGGFMAKNQNLNIAYVTTDTQVQVNMKYAWVDISLNGTDDVLNRGRNAAFSTVELKFANASAKMAKILTQGLYQDGQTAAGNAGIASGIFSTNLSFDGLLAWIDDGNSSGSYSTATDLTRSFLAIGGNNRVDMFSTPPTFTGSTTPTTAVAELNSFTNRAFNAFTLNDIQFAFGQAWFGNDFPDLGVCTQNGWNKLWNATQPLQRYMDDVSDVAKIGFKAFRFNGVCEMVVDKYMPEDSTNGIMYLLNTRYLEFFVSDNPKWSFGFTGFKDAQGNVDLAGQFLFSGDLIATNPRTSSKLVGTALF
jgi:hypothetical protein